MLGTVHSLPILRTPPLRLCISKIALEIVFRARIMKKEWRSRSCRYLTYKYAVYKQHVFVHQNFQGGNGLWWDIHWSKRTQTFRGTKQSKMFCFRQHCFWKSVSRQTSILAQCWIMVFPVLIATGFSAVSEEEGLGQDSAALPWDVWECACLLGLLGPKSLEIIHHTKKDKCFLKAKSFNTWNAMWRKYKGSVYLWQ